MRKFLPIIAVLVTGVIIYLIVAKIKNLPPFQDSVPSTLKGLINADGKPIMTNGMYIRGYIDKKGKWIGGMLKDDTYNWKQSANGNACICTNSDHKCTWCTNYVPPDKSHTDFAIVYKDGNLSVMDVTNGQYVKTILSNPKSTQVKLSATGPVLL